MFACHRSDVQTDYETFVPLLLPETHCESRIFVFISVLFLKEDKGKGESCYPRTGHEGLEEE